MPIRRYKPTSPGRRFMSVSTFEEITKTTPEKSLAFRALFGNRTYTRRVIQLLAVWFLAYVTVFGFSAGFTSMLVALKYPRHAQLGGDFDQLAGVDRIHPFGIEADLGL